MDQDKSDRFIKIITDGDSFEGQSIYEFSAQRKQFSIFDNEQKFISIFFNGKRYVYALKPEVFQELMEIMQPQRVNDTNEFIIPEEFEEMIEDFLLVPSMIAD